MNILSEEQIRKIIIAAMGNNSYSEFGNRRNVYNSARNAIREVCLKRKASKQEMDRQILELESAISAIELSFQLDVE